ncbi:MAG: sugar O-acetyltransferase [Bacteroidota bacterium]|nr:sugar O-acetyltransferase [Bacteroidota bacterium]
MKTEMEKCLAGEWYDCHDEVFLELKKKTHNLLMKYNSLPYGRKEEKYEVLKEMFGSIGTSVSIGHSFICDYGCNIYIGNNVSINTSCTFVDCNKITIGNNVLIAPNVQIYTATHPIELNERLAPVGKPENNEYIRHTFALPVAIEDGCWIGGGVIILPGITIGKGSVIGAGSVVTRNIPANSLALGNPCRVIRKINGVQNSNINEDHKS